MRGHTSLLSFYVFNYLTINYASFAELTSIYVFQVEALQGYRVIDIACGSGDAQTLCLTDDDTVWSWGDGDYGKLGRGGSDGCKVPMKVCRSQNSLMV